MKQQQPPSPPFHLSFARLLICGNPSAFDVCQRRVRVRRMRGRLANVHASSCKLHFADFWVMGRGVGGSGDTQNRRIVGFSTLRTALTHCVVWARRTKLIQCSSSPVTSLWIWILIWTHTRAQHVCQIRQSPLVSVSSDTFPSASARHFSIKANRRQREKY